MFLNKKNLKNNYYYIFKHPLILSIENSKGYNLTSQVLDLLFRGY
jgi:hypothetical protein